MSEVRSKEDGNTSKWAVMVTVLWLVAILGYGAFRWLAQGGWPAPNTVGDFLAGAFSPVAFFWLILGYRQQGAELRLQVEELRRSVEQQEAMARNMLQSHEFSVEQDIRVRRASLLGIQPVLRVRIDTKLPRDDPEKLAVMFKLCCYKNPAMDLSIYRNDDTMGHRAWGPRQTMEPNSELLFTIVHPFGSPIREVFFAYLDSDGSRRTQVAELHPTGGPLALASFHLSDPTFVYPDELKMPIAQNEKPA